MTFTIPEFWLGFALGFVANLALLIGIGFYLASAKKRLDKKEK